MRAAIAAIVLLVVLAAVLGGNLVRSDYLTDVNVPIEQPIPFSHRHHVGGIGIDCRYCHVGVEDHAFAGMPPTDTCMTCHSQVWADAPMLQPVFESFETDRSIEWVRVHNLPDFVYFDHSIHVQKGIGCVTCHGRVDDMPLIEKRATLHMQWCLDCHREPERYVRPREKVFDMDWVPDEDQRTLGARLVEEYGIRRAMSCTDCHR